MNEQVLKMTVRGGKNRVLVYTGAGLLLVALVLFYHNAATRLDDARTKYDKCHLNEESLSAQLQVILEYKTRLEKSLQQEKSDHAQTKEDMRNKAEEERQTREKENLESINKFTALQQQYKLLQSQHEDVTQELEKAKQQMLTGEEERSHLEGQISSLAQQNKLLQDNMESDGLLLKSKLLKLEADYETLKKDGNSSRLLKEKSDLQRELADCLRNHSEPTQKKTAEAAMPEETLDAPALSKRSPTLKSSTAASKVEVVSGGAVYFNTSTPMINPDAVQSQDRTAPGGQIGKLLHIPAVQEFREQQANQESELVRPLPQMPQVPPPANRLPQLPQPINNIPRDFGAHAYDDYNQMDARKEEDGQDDDDPDQWDFPNPGDKGPDPANPPPRPQVIPQQHDGVMVNPK